jgi:hypothetical protein
MSPYLENQRDKFAPLFLVAPIEGGVEILFAGALFITLERDDRLPPGFFDRTVAHVMDLLSGRRSALWDEQAIFGDKPFDRDQARARASSSADLDAAARDRGTE